MNDEKIISLLFGRSEDGIKELERQYGKLVRSIALNVLNNEEDAGECVNDTWMAVWNTIPPKRPDSLARYVSKITRNIALRRFRDEHRKKRSGVVASIEEFAENFSGKTLEEDYNLHSLIEGINTYLGKLPKENRLMWTAYYWAGVSKADIAKRMGYSANAVSIRLSRIKKDMLEFLKKEGLI